MPLHLLGKKSWNVYNPENIERVRRDEEAAQAEVAREEREKNDAAAATRLQVLRGQALSIIQPTEIAHSHDHTVGLRMHNASRSRRNLAGENDTDKDIRLARVDQAVHASEQCVSTIFDSNGHIDLIPNHPHKQDTKQEKRKDEEVTGMRFKDAAGYQTDGNPWYTDKRTGNATRPQDNKDIWGNEDFRRQEREQQRLTANDPLLAMRKGVQKLREKDRQRKDWLEQREKDLYEVERLAQERGRKRRRRSVDEDNLDGFSLDAPPSSHKHSGSSRDLERRHDRRRHRHHLKTSGHRHHHRNEP